MPGGRPSKYSPELGAQINELISNGKTLIAVCEELSLVYGTVKRWVKDIPEFRADHGRARVEQAAHFADEVKDIADKSYDILPNGLVQRIDPRDKEIRIKARQWAAGKLDPARFGDKLAVEHSGSIGLVVMQMSRTEVIARLQELAVKGAPIPQALLEAPSDEPVVQQVEPEDDGIVDAEFEDVVAEHPGAEFL